MTCHSFLGKMLYYWKDKNFWLTFTPLVSFSQGFSDSKMSQPKLRKVNSRHNQVQSSPIIYIMKNNWVIALKHVLESRFITLSSIYRLRPNQTQIWTVNSGHSLSWFRCTEDYSLVPLSSLVWVSNTVIVFNIVLFLNHISA